MVLQAGFLYFAAVIVFCALMVVTRKNPVHSVLFMLPLFFHVAGLFVMLDAEFLAAVQVLVYAGAIMVLFLFVIMLFNLHIMTDKKWIQPGWPLIVPIVLALGGSMMSIVMKADFSGTEDTYTTDVVRNIGNAQVVGKVLYTDFIFPFEVASVILLVAMVGAIVLARKKED